MQLSDNLKELSARLQEVETSAEQRDGLTASRLYAGSVMSEIVNPLEALNNLLFLLQRCLDSPEKAASYVEMAQQQTLQLNEVTRRTLLFCQGTRPPEG